MQNKKTKINIYDMAVVGVMAAIIFVITYFIRIPVATPVGETQLKLANAFCLLAGILFGGVRGGLAAGIGSMFFDLLNPKYIASAPFTLVFFFLMAFVCGVISHSANAKGEKTVKNIIASLAGGFTYYLLYLTKTVVERMLEGAVFNAAIVSIVPKIITSGINLVVAVVIASVLAPILKKALNSSGFYKKIDIA